MIKITPNSAWTKFARLFGEETIIDRYYWFLFEFGKRASRLYMKELKERISNIPGSSEYKKRLMITEIRDKGKRAWWGVVVNGLPLAGTEYDPKKSIFYVASRLKDEPLDPVWDILDSLGPWTVDTLPFIPSNRAGAIIMKTVSESECAVVREANLKQGTLVTTRMIKHGVTFDDRHVVYKKLRVIRDYEAEAIGHEFGTRKNAVPHWRPSLRWLKRQGIQKLGRDKDLFRAMTDLNFNKWRMRRHFKFKLTPAELKRIQRFQDKVRV